MSERNSVHGAGHHHIRKNHVHNPPVRQCFQGCLTPDPPHSLLDARLHDTARRDIHFSGAALGRPALSGPTPPLEDLRAVLSPARDWLADRFSAGLGYRAAEPSCRAGTSSPWPPEQIGKAFCAFPLVTCPVAVYRATSESEKVSFNQLDRKTGHRIKYSKLDADTGEEVANEDIVSGYNVDTTPSSR